MAADEKVSEAQDKIDVYIYICACVYMRLYQEKQFKQ